jgi:hypothetical protein
MPYIVGNTKVFIYALVKILSMTIKLILEKDCRLQHHGEAVRITIPRDWAKRLGFSKKKLLGKKGLFLSDEYGFFVGFWNPDKENNSKNKQNIEQAAEQVANNNQAGEVA